MKLRVLLISLTVCLVWIQPSQCLDAEIIPSCPATDSVCRFNWTINQQETMMLYQNGQGYPIVYRDGSFKKRLTCGSFLDVTPEELEEANVADGLQKFVYTINNQVPGPTIVVYDHQEIEVTVTNAILHEGVAIHWHGLYNIGTPFMDGVPGVTQCTINPLETFVYRFKAQPYGTHWYHSHLGAQRTDGIYGGLIILRQDENTTLPAFATDYLFMFHDWFPHSASVDIHAFMNGLTFYMEYGFNATECVEPIGNTLINGRGYVYDGNDPLVPVPLTTYTITEGNFYRLRLLNTGLMHPYKVHVDQHKMVVIASDGAPVVPFETDYVVLHSGERYDVYIEANQAIDNYWVRVEYVDIQSPPGLAILRYDSAPDELPTSTHTECTALDNCEVANCPFRAFNDTSLQFACSYVGDMHSTGEYRYFDVPHEQLRADAEEQAALEEHFFVVEASEAVDGVERPAVNAIHYIPPTSPPQVTRVVDFEHDCEQYYCDAEPCQCTHLVQLTKGNVIQMVFVSAVNPYGHPMHLHGHNFQVLKVAHGETGLAYHPDIKCNSAQLGRCTNPFWRNSSWAGGNVPGINDIDPPEKDTVIVPTGGYVVVRFTAQNPGFWMYHCHVDFHLAAGMGLIIQEGELTDMPAPPTGFPTCGSFMYDQGTQDNSVEVRAAGQDATQSPHQWAAYLLGSFLGGVVLALAVVYSHNLYQKRRNKGRVEDIQMQDTRT